TVFNLLGPLTNPAGAQVQLVGVASAAVGEKLARVLNLLDTYRAWVVHGEDGLDEMTLSSPTRVWEVKDRRVHSFTVDPENAGLHRVPLSELKGGSAEENAATLKELLQGKQGPLRDVVLLNSAAVLVAAERADDLRQGVQLAAEVIDSGEALQRLEKLVELSRTLR
ncbi:MAG: anthranilate phosphoribosyltransferase, partial [Dehalococcoidia bacterium]